MVPRRLIAALALLVVGLLGVGVTTAVRRAADEPSTAAQPQPTASPTDSETTEPLPTEPAAPTESPSAIPTVAPTPTAPTTGSGSGSGSNQALGPPAPSMPDTGPVAAVFIVGAFSAIAAIVVHRRFFR